MNYIQFEMVKQDTLKLVTMPHAKYPQENVIQAWMIAFATDL